LWPPQAFALARRFPQTLQVTGFLAAALAFFDPDTLFTHFLLIYFLNPCVWEVLCL
jgi:hypothetical protein